MHHEGARRKTARSCEPERYKEVSNDALYVGREYTAEECALNPASMKSKKNVQADVDRDF